MSSFRKKITLRRSAAGTTEDGNFIPGATTDSDIYASVQPIKPFDVQFLPEGRRTCESLWIFTDSEIRPVQDGINPDKVVIGTAVYEVAKVSSWQNGVLPHYEALVYRVE